MAYYDLMGADQYDLLGELEILGDDVDMMGAARRPVARPASPRPAARPSAVGVRASGPTRSRRLILPIDTGAVAILGGAAATINLSSSQPFRATQLRLDPVAAPNWLIVDVKVGRKSQLLGTGAIPASVFSAANPDCAVGFDTAQATETVQLLLQNMSGAASRLTGAMIGETIE
jgi:hypothetical protein